MSLLSFCFLIYKIHNKKRRQWILMNTGQLCTRMHSSYFLKTHVTNTSTFFLAVFVVHLTHEVHDIDAMKQKSQN